MIYLYWSAGAKDALDGRTVFSKPGGGTRVGEQLAGCRCRCAATRRAAGLQCAPFVIAHASSRESSVFDNGLPKAGDRLDRGRQAGGADADQALGRQLPDCR